MTTYTRSRYMLASGRTVSVIDIEDDYVTYVLEGVRTLLPLRKRTAEFLRMVGQPSL